ncbi:MAG: type II toxin-antitoxin system RelE/ParE family toxin [Pyrinomonadaceae bacterium]|nr:type II toxin-antitoxin system RelE/ParE family toxin [Blastocatellia bacterium]MDQ3489664.1 type II toxin-antitoxin system RelE/ParE family toxin [Acidobacteriota bacterium]
MVRKNLTYFSFTETTVFTRHFDKLTRLETLYALQDELISNPRAGSIIKGTNGARKIRARDVSDMRGKRGSFRCIYLYLEKNELIYLLVFYGKNDQDNLTPEEKKQVARTVKMIKDAHGE